MVSGARQNRPRIADRAQGARVRTVSAASPTCRQNCRFKAQSKAMPPSAPGTAKACRVASKGRIISENQICAPKVAKRMSGLKLAHYHQEDGLSQDGKAKPLARPANSNAFRMPVDRPSTTYFQSCLAVSFRMFTPFFNAN